jgi:hypothetical protein
VCVCVCVGGGGGGRMDRSNQRQNFDATKETMLNQPQRAASAMPLMSFGAAKFQHAVVFAAVAWALFFTALRDPSETLQPLPVYDYIVVGSGSAGAVVASRLSENPNISVLLLEAGPPDTFWGSKFLMQIPALTPHFQRSNKDWAFRTQPQQNAARALNDHISAWPRGRVLGGSSVLNYMQYVRLPPAPLSLCPPCL